MKRFAGPKPVKQVKLKIFAPGNKSYKTTFVKVPNGQQFRPEGIEFVLRQAAKNIEEGFPLEEYSLRQLGRAEFNFVHVGKKPVDEAALLVGGVPLGEVATVEVGQ